MAGAIQTQDEVRLIDLRHPFFSANEEDWQLWRDCYQGGRNFINRYLKQFSKREDPDEFSMRREMTFCPAFAASAVDDVKNSIYERMVDIAREGGSSTYETAVTGANGGVDLCGSSMNYFIGQLILPELLTMRTVGVYVDMPPVNGQTLMEVVQSNAQPYIYMYKAEEILNWSLDLSSSQNDFSQIMVREYYDVIHPKFGLPYKTDTRIRHMYLNGDGLCACDFYNEGGDLIDAFGSVTNVPNVLPINQIPFVMLQLPYSLLKEIARYQIALLNIASSDVNYILRANFPFYTEQQDWRSNSQYTRPAGSGEGDAISAQQSTQSQDVSVGSASGRAYGMGLERPGFINPSSEPLKASMEKQEQLKREIRLLINIALTNMTPTKQQSVESKQMDQQGLEAGLSFIGLELEKAERKIAEFWAMYEKGISATIHYPTRYSLKSDSERREEATYYQKMLPEVPSPTYQKALAIQLARTLLGYKTSRQTMDKIEKEIMAAPFVGVSPEILQKDVELGILSHKYASDSRLYPSDNVETANQEHAIRLATIQASQTKAPVTPQYEDPALAARGNPDGSANPTQVTKAEKTASRNTDMQANPTLAVRGKS